jgi:hypothetical protein
VSSPDKLLHGLRESGIDDERLRKRGGQNVFDVLRSLGVEDPKQQLVTALRDELTSEDSKIPSAISLGPWYGTGSLGFVNTTDYALELVSSNTKYTGGFPVGISSQNLINGSPISLPSVLEPDALLEVTVSAWGAVGSVRMYRSFRVKPLKRRD